jgi:tRNA (guanine37-N1)-methyltransferase
VAPRAFDTIGDIAIAKVPPALWERRAEVGEALRRFTGARAAFHDRGVRDPYRTRDLERIAGEGGSLTQVRENGVGLWVDPARAYYSPRLAAERARVAQQCRPGEVVVDLFGGVAPFGVQLARRGADVHTVDLNPAATELARRNAALNRVALHVHTGDARGIAGLPTADRVIMNLPHGARGFLDVAASLLRPRAVLHYHEMVAPAQAEARARDLEETLAALGWPCRVRTRRTVRNYSPQEEHMVFDLEGAA